MTSDPALAWERQWAAMSRAHAFLPPRDAGRAAMRRLRGREGPVGRLRRSRRATSGVSCSSTGPTAPNPRRRSSKPTPGSGVSPSELKRALVRLAVGERILRRHPVAGFDVPSESARGPVAKAAQDARVDLQGVKQRPEPVAGPGVVLPTRPTHGTRDEAPGS